MSSDTFSNAYTDSRIHSLLQDYAKSSPSPSCLNMTRYLENFNFGLISMKISVDNNGLTTLRPDKNNPVLLSTFFYANSGLLAALALNGDLNL